MKCEKCGNEVKIKDAKFCPFCGGKVEPEKKFAGYSRATFFNVTGDEEFQDVWETLKSMSADDALAWFRERPPVRYVWKFCGSWIDGTRIYKKRREQCIYRQSIKILLNDGGTVTAKEYRLCVNDLTGIGDYVFWTKEECEAAIKAETEIAAEAKTRTNDLNHDAPK